MHRDRIQRWLALASCAVLASCVRPATQLLVVVESDYPAGALARVEVTATPAGGTAGPEDPRVFVVGPALAIPFSFGVEPPREGARRVELDVIARDASGRVRATHRVRTGFLTGQTLRLPVFLAQRCETVVCDPDERCDASGACVDIEIDETTLERVEPGSELRDAGPIEARDAGPIEARDAFVAPLALPTHAEAYAHTAGTDVRGLVRLPDGALVVMAQRFGASPGASIVAYDHDGASITQRWRITTQPAAVRPIVVGAGIVLNAGLGDTAVDVVADRTVTLTRPAELVMGDNARGLVGVGADGRVGWTHTLWSRPAVAGESSQVWCQVCELAGPSVLLVCEETGGGTLMLDDAPLALGAPLGGTHPPGEGALIRARVTATGLEGLEVVRWFGGAHDAYCTADDAGGFYAAFRHTDVLVGLDRPHDPRGADTMTVARFASDGALRWSERIVSVRRNVSTPSASYPACYKNLTLAAAPSGFYFASWLPEDSPDCLRELENGSGAVVSAWTSYPMVSATLGPEGEVGPERVHVGDLGGVSWALTVHPSGDVLLAGHVDATMTNGSVLGLPYAVAGASDGLLLALDPLGRATWQISGRSTFAGSSDAFLGVTTEPSGAIWIASLHTTAPGMVLDAMTPSTSLVRLE